MMPGWEEKKDWWAHLCWWAHHRYALLRYCYRLFAGSRDQRELRSKSDEEPKMK